ncbi:galactoside alpha-(1,2)-fucosyltransferase 2-like isoform X2 [Ambystoma mexicanum]|uniref:galactoside alpha-(1,2)-fucosyltransferase 2-like isoform X2 n=1 Tax=Ambystoma mexicanum TaxID=8296 RepID=UPI0037E78CC2
MKKWYRKRKLGFWLAFILTGTTCFIFMYINQSRFLFKILGITIYMHTRPYPKHLQNYPCNATCRMVEGIWSIKPSGRLGNQMGEYATLYALAKLNGHRAYISPEMYNILSPLFKISLPVIDIGEYIETPWKDYWLHDWMSEEYKLIEGKNVRFTGFPCSWTFYDHIRDEIHKEFTFRDYIKEAVNPYLKKLKGSRKNATYIGVHVRRGDYVHVMPNTWKGVIADQSFLDKSMTYFRDKYKEPVFVVASNEMKWCKQNIDNSKGDVYFSGDGKEHNPGKDFALLAHCNHTIMTIGTFGYWAGYLAGGMTIYLTNFTLPNSPLLKLFRYDTTFLPHWMGIPADLTPLKVSEDALLR